MQTTGRKMETSRLLGCVDRETDWLHPVDAQLYKLLTFSVVPAVRITHTGPFKDDYISVCFYRYWSPTGAFGEPVIT